MVFKVKTMVNLGWGSNQKKIKGASGVLLLLDLDAGYVQFVVIHGAVCLRFMPFSKFYYTSVKCTKMLKDVEQAV